MQYMMKCIHRAVKEWENQIPICRAQSACAALQHRVSQCLVKHVKHVHGTWRGAATRAGQMALLQHWLVVFSGQGECRELVEQIRGKEGTDWREGTGRRIGP